MQPNRMTIREETERGDVTRSLEGVINSQFISKRFKDIMSATRLTRYEILTFALMEIVRIVSKINSLSYADMKETSLALLQEEERKEIYELWSLKKRFMRNPHALAFVICDSFVYMYGLGLQSLDGLSRQEGTSLIAGSYQKLLDPDEMGTFEKLRKRLLGNVIYPA